MAERTMIPGRGAMVVALAALLGVAVGASWQRRASETVAGAHPSPSGKPDVSRAAAGFTVAGFVPPGLVEVLQPEKASARIRDHSRNLFDFTESPGARKFRMANDRRIARQQQHDREERDRQANRKLADHEARAEAEAKWLAAHPKPPVVTLSLIGKIGAPRAPMAILAAADGEVYTARVGETICGTFRLLSLDFETATIGYAPALVAAQPEWASVKTTLRMGVR